jgi:O-antigen/teichoic acid export membrane protein
MSTTRALAWNTGVQILGKVLSTAIGVMVVGLMTRYLGQVGFGMYSTANAFFQVFAIMLDLGLNVMLVQMLGERAGDDAYERRAVSATFTLRIVTALVLLTIAPFIALLIPSYPHELKIAIFAIWGSFFFASLNQIVIGVQQRHLKMQAVAIAEVLGRLTLLIGLLIAMKLGWGLIPIVLIVSLGGLINFAVNILVAMRYADFRWNWDPEFWKTLLRRAWPIGVSILFNLIYFKADTLVLSLVRPFEEVGIYSAAYRVLEILVTLPFMYTGVALPLMAQAWAKKDVTRFQNLLRQSFVAMTFLAAPMLVGIYVIGGQVMQLIAGEGFESSGDILKILMLAVAIIFFGTVSSHAIVAVDAQRKMIAAYVVTALVTLLGYILLIPTYGIWAAAWLTVFSEGCVAIATTVVSLRRSKTQLPWMALGKCALAAVLMGLAIYPLRDLWIPIPILVGACVYLVLTLVFGVASRATMKEILSLRRDTPPAELS